MNYMTNSCFKPRKSSIDVVDSRHVQAQLGPRSSVATPPCSGESSDDTQYIKLRRPLSPTTTTTITIREKRVKKSK